MSSDELKKSKYYGIKKYDEAQYEGDIINGKREGFGILKYNNGRIYEGNWVNDRREGKGRERYSNGNIYEGDFKNSKAEGKGIYKWERRFKSCSLFFFINFK